MTALRAETFVCDDLDPPTRSGLAEPKKDSTALAKQSSIKLEFQQLEDRQAEQGVADNHEW